MMPNKTTFCSWDIDNACSACYNTHIPPRGIYEKRYMMEKHEHTKVVLNRMSRAIGHMNAVKRMIEDERDCSEVLIQLSAVRSEIANLSKVILKDHIDHCVVEAVRENDEEAIENLKGAIDRLI